MEKFIYVFSDENRDRLLACGCTLLKSDTKNQRYVFANDGSALMFDALTSMSYIKSDSITF